MSKPQRIQNESNVYRVPQGLFLCKLILKKHGTVQIEAMGEPISLVTKFVQLLKKDNYVVVNSVQAHNASDSGSINPKLVVVLGKSDKFDDLTQQIVLRKKEADTPKA